MSTLTYEGLVADLDRIKRELAMPAKDPVVYSNVAAPPLIGGMPSFGGIRVFESPFIEPIHVSDEITEIPISKNRSRRIFKKLCKRRQANARPIKQDVAYVLMGR